jgi:hypothetical protein
MNSLPTVSGCPALRVIPLPFALYESNGLLFELYDGGQPSQPVVIRWERLQPVQGRHQYVERKSAPKPNR